MTNFSFSKLVASAGLSVLAMSVVACSSNSGSGPSGSVSAQGKPELFKPLVTMSIEEGSMPVGSGVPSTVKHKYTVADGSRGFNLSLNELPDGNSGQISQDGADYQIADTCEGSACGEIVMTITRKLGDKTASRAFLYVRTGESKFAEVCSQQGLSEDPNKAVEALMSTCDPQIEHHDSAPGPKSVSAQSKSDSAPGPQQNAPIGASDDKHDEASGPKASK